MSSQMRYMEGDVKPRTYRTPTQAIMQGSANNPWGVKSQFSIEKGDLLFQDPLSGCVYPAQFIPTQATANEYNYQLAFAQYFVGVADEKIALNPGELTYSANQRYQPTIKVLTGGVFEYPTPNETFVDFNAPVGIAATASGIANAQTVDLVSPSNSNTTINHSGGYTSTATSIIVTSASTLSLTAGLSVISVATTGASNAVPTLTSLSVPTTSTSTTSSVLLPLTSGVAPGAILQSGSEMMYVTGVAGFSTATTLTNAISSGATSFVVGSTYGIVPGTFISIGNELMLVTAVNYASATVTVTRGFDSTTAASASAAAAITVYPTATVTRGYNNTTASAISSAAVVIVTSAPPEQMLVTAISTNTLTVVRGYNGTVASAIANSAVVTNLTYDWSAAAQSAKIGTVVPTPGLATQIANASQQGLGFPQQSRICIEIQPALRFGGIPTAGTYTGVSGQ
jgi:hypothetical protein